MTLRTSLAEVIKATPASRATATGRLERFGGELFREHEVFGGEAERKFLESGQARTQADVARIGGEASDLTRRAFTTSRGTLERQRRALGDVQTERERRSTGRRLGLAQVLSDVDTRNRALMTDQARREQARVSAGGLRDIIDQAALGGLAGAASAETAREVEHEQAMAQYEADKNAALGSLVGVGLSFVPGLGAANTASGGAISSRIAGAF